MEKIVLAAVRHLKKADPILERLIKHHGRCTLFDNDGLMHKSKFHVLCWAIINQQVSVSAAQSIENKLLARLSSEHFTHRAIIALDDSELAACGLSRQKIRYLRELSDAVSSGRMSLEELEHADNRTVAEILTALPGIGPWTVDMFLMFSLGRLDVLPLGDLALRKSIAAHYTLPDKATIEDYLAVAQPWQPYQTIASWYLWAAVD